MGQNNNNNNITNSKSDNIEDWRNEHGDPSFEYLQSLAMDGSPESLEKLKSIAEDLDVEYDANALAEELIEKIRAVTDQNEDDITNPTS